MSLEDFKIFFYIKRILILIYVPVLLNKSKILTQLFEGGIVVLNEVDSTNQYIMDNIKYLRAGDVCVAEYQTSGRGRGSKIWISPFGKNICLSMYWRLNYTPPTIMELSLMVSIIVARTLQNLGVSHIKIKWPNDLYINGKKLAGILIEIITRKNYITHVIIGIGINLSMYTFKKLAINVSNSWISLEDIGIVIDRNILVATLINVLRKKLKYFECYGFKSFIFYWKDFNYLYKN